MSDIYNRPTAIVSLNYMTMLDLPSGRNMLISSRCSHAICTFHSFVITTTIVYITDQQSENLHLPL